MTKRTGPTNIHTRELIQILRRESTLQKAKLWKRIADDLEKPRRQRRIVNISKIARNTKPNETIIIPGKVLGSGKLQHSLTIAALEFSEKAKKLIEQSKGKAITIQELLKQKTKTSQIKIIG
ncbi:50S ribosomal protein L18e [Candidatus Woesearchaeota archaeon]|nr:MAG: 50S ribosomal protein L18e [Candidatus Woesearchaeota archaeon ex4484_78]RLE47125.1 MAG: 50S ribosomal protein L18e [Candidatus Woesearchaeota archaeon]